MYKIKQITDNCSVYVTIMTQIPVSDSLVTGLGELFLDVSRTLNIHMISLIDYYYALLFDDFSENINIYCIFIIIIIV